MNELIEKKIQKARIFRAVTLAFVAIYLCSYFLFNFLEPGIVMLIVMPVGLIAFIDALIYFGRFHPLLRSMKLLAKDEQEHLIQDIPTDQPTLPRSKIYCGSRAMYSMRPHVVIPYSQFGWVYLYERRSYGITVEKAVIIRTKDGRKISLSADTDEINYLLSRYVAPQVPDLLVGFGKEEAYQYLERNPAAKAIDRRGKLLWGIVLLAIAALLLIISLVNGTLEPAILFIIAIPAIAGAIMLFLGFKK